MSNSPSVLTSPLHRERLGYAGLWQAPGFLATDHRPLVDTFTGTARSRSEDEVDRRSIWGAVGVGLVASLANAQGAGARYADGTQLLRAMHDRYANTWYKTMTFVQTTTQWDTAGKKKVSTWYETAAVPSLLRIDIGSPKDGNGVLYTADSTYVIKKGQLARTVPGGNDLTTLLFDVYVDAVDNTVRVLQRAGYDLSKVRQDTWESQAVWVVGADAGDLKGHQFWVDPKLLVVVRQIGSPPGDPTVLDAQFSKYVRSGGGWIAMRNYFLVDGKPVQLEEYQDVKADPPLDRALFDPHQWMTAKHWAK